MRNNADAGRRRRNNGRLERENAQRRYTFKLLGLQRAAHETVRSAWRRAVSRHPEWPKDHKEAL